MDLDRFLDVLATIFGGVGAIYVIRSLVSMSPTAMATLSQAGWDLNLDTVEALTAQKAEGIVALVLVILALLVSLANSAFVPPGVRAFPTLGWGLGLVLGLGVFTYVTLLYVGGAIQKQQKREVGRVLLAQWLDRLGEKKQLTEEDVQTLDSYSGRLIGVSRAQGERARLFVQRVAAETRPGAAEKLDYSLVEAPAPTQ
jgi:hypothetical protein